MNFEFDDKRIVTANWQRCVLLGLLLVISFLILFPLGCKEDSTGPIEPPPGKRDYTWTTDTISYPGSFQTLMRDIWASSPKDVYVVGYNDQAGEGTMYHFDGVKWTPVRLLTVQGGTIKQGFELSAIYGFASNDLWAVGEYIYDNPNPPPNFLDSSLIIHFDGRGWTEYPTSGGRALRCIWMSSTSDGWAAGTEGTLFHFDGIKWVKYGMDNNYFYNSITGLSSTEVYTIGYREDRVAPNDSAGYFLFKYGGSNWRIIDSVMQTPDALPPRFGLTIWSDGKQLYSVGSNIYRYENNNWSKVFDGPVGHVCKTSDQNIFAVGASVYHFNGTDWKEFTQFHTVPGLIWFNCYTDGQETFILGNDLNHIPQQTIILHGK